MEKVLGKEEIVMNTLVIIEISHFLIKNLGSIKGKQKTEDMLDFSFIIKDFDYHLLLDSVKMLSEYNHTGIGGRDATILVTMKNSGIEKLVTHDNSFKKIDFIEVIDPIKT